MCSAALIACCITLGQNLLVVMGVGARAADVVVAAGVLVVPSLLDEEEAEEPIVEGANFLEYCETM